MARTRVQSVFAIGTLLGFYSVFCGKAVLGSIGRLGGIFGSFFRYFIAFVDNCMREIGFSLRFYTVLLPLDVLQGEQIRSFTADL